jgi:hypothetical protein
MGRFLLLGGRWTILSRTLKTPRRQLGSFRAMIFLDVKQTAAVDRAGLAIASFAALA